MKRAYMSVYEEFTYLLAQTRTQSPKTNGLEPVRGAAARGDLVALKPLTGK